MSVFMEHFKLVLGLLAMAGMAYLFTFYLDADIGVVVFAFLLIAGQTFHGICADNGRKPPAGAVSAGGAPAGCQFYPG